MLMQKIKRETATLRDILYHRLYYKPGSEQGIIDQFHKLYYDASNFGETWANTWWRGVPALKCPLDLWIYQEIIYELKPDLIIETGTCLGGSALYLANLCDMMGHGNVVTVDIETVDMLKARLGKVPPIVRPVHPRIRYIVGSSISPEVLKEIKETAQKATRILILLDSDHSQRHVREELRHYTPLVSKDSYVIVEDTNINGHPVYPGYGPGPMEAVDDFLKDNDEFIIDKGREKLMLTMNPRGFLKRVK